MAGCRPQLPASRTVPRFVGALPGHPVQAAHLPTLASFPVPRRPPRPRCAEVNGQATPDLDAFLAVVRQLPDGADVRVRLVHFESSKSKVGKGAGAPQRGRRPGRERRPPSERVCGCVGVRGGVGHERCSRTQRPWPAACCHCAMPCRAPATGPQVLTLKTDHRYWPTWRLVLDPERAEWARVPVSPSA